MEKVVNKNYLASFYKSKKVFVTGHTGFKGSWLVAWLYQLGAITKGYALQPEYDDFLFNQLPDNYCESIIADIRNKEKLTAEILSFQPDYIFHLAAQPLVRRSYEIPAETFEVNAIGTANLLEATTAILNNTSYAQAARKVSQTLAKTDAAQRFRDVVAEMLRQDHNSSSDQPRK